MRSSRPVRRARRRGVVVEAGVGRRRASIRSPVERVLDQVPPALVDLALWLADYYGRRRRARSRSWRRGRARPRAAAGRRATLAGEAEPASERPAGGAVADRGCSTAGGGHLLLHGATGSGKTEVYLQACAAALARGRGRSCSCRDRADAADGRPFRAPLRRPRRRAPLRASPTPSGATSASGSAREAPLVVGARSAVFAPVRALGLICVDEEHDSSYKQESDPRYDARTVAAKRAALEGAVAVYGSATPRPESWRGSSGSSSAADRRRRCRRCASSTCAARPATRSRRRCSRSSAGSPRTGARRSCS